jgi:hypothetical protein
VCCLVRVSLSLSYIEGKKNVSEMAATSGKPNA